MRFLTIFLAISLIFATFSSFSSGITRKKLLNSLLRFQNCGARNCPPWKCQDDSAVIHGYCCGCPGSEDDNVPIPCYPDLICPPSPEPLCTDYNYMMDCCCSGP